MTAIISSALVVGLTVAPSSSASSALAIVPSPNATTLPYSQLGGATCAGVNNCFAVGRDENGSGSVSTALVEHWNGTAWSLMRSPNPTAYPSVALSDVACPSTSNCFAVGLDENASGSLSTTLVEHWNGTAWSLMPSPDPTGPLAPSLSDVACPSTINCFAVGQAWNETASIAKTLVEHWNGTRWSIMPSPSAGSDELTGVTCPSMNNCFAVGDDINQETGAWVALVEHWNGTRWSIVPSPKPNAIIAELSSVSCPSATNCYAVGDYGGSGDSLITRTLVEHWNGTRWSIVRSPNAPTESNGEASLLIGVECATTTDCLAVGYDTPNSTAVARALVEHWDGTSWSIVPSPHPTGQAAALLYGVACPKASNCFAVGWDFNAGLSVAKTLVLRYA